MEQREIDYEDADATAAAVLVEACMDGDEAPDPVLVARALGVPVLPTPSSYMVGRLGDFAEVDGALRIHVRRGLGGPPLLFTVAHELAHVVVRRWGLRVEREELWANAFAGALLVPPGPLVESWRRGRDLRPLLRRWEHVPPTCTVLRLGETRCADVYVTQGRSVRYARAATMPVEGVVELGLRAVRRGPVRRGDVRACRLGDGVERAAVVSAA